MFASPSCSFSGHVHGSSISPGKTSVLEEEAQVLLVQLPQRCCGTINRGIEDKLLLLLEFNDLLLDSVRTDETHSFHRFRLSNAMCPLYSLHLACRIPPRIQQEDMVGHLEVQTLSTSFQRNKNHLHVRVVVEGSQGIFPCLHGHATAKDHAGYSGALHAKLDKLKHCAKLREDDSLGSLVTLHHLLHFVKDSLNLRAALELRGLDLLHDGLAAKIAFGGWRSR
mmetsp:Transcript_91003/g.161982  ORF Transcript_91003/g.161982 Transcript_91003/m.161982 type:complete len:224 (+) Transcript_91003:58-729(+)